MQLLFNVSQPRHKVFVSYHHANDQAYRNHFEALFKDKHDIQVSKPAQIGDIDLNRKTETVRQQIRDEHLSDSTVTVVLIGAETWKRKYVDWEIAASIQDTQNNPRSGLIGIILPTNPYSNALPYIRPKCPPRLIDNVTCGFAQLYDWNTNPSIVQNWIHEAFERKDKINPDNSYPSYSNNRETLLGALVSVYTRQSKEAYPLGRKKRCYTTAHNDW